MSERVEYGTFEAALERSRVLEKKLEANPEQYKILTAIGLLGDFISATILAPSRIGSAYIGWECLLIL